MSMNLTIPLQQGGPALPLLRRLLPLPPAALRSALQQGCITLGDAPVTADMTLPAGGQLCCTLADDLLPPLRILWQGQQFCAVEKPVGMVVCDDPGLTLQRLLSHRLGMAALPCHRLDATTGGVVLFALSPAAEAAGVALFQQRALQKQYQCLCGGRPLPHGDLHDFLQKDARAGRVRITRTAGRGALAVHTEYHLLESRKGVHRLLVDLHTGRTHQIRAHLAFHGLPLLGDDKYGDRTLNRRLHARTPALWAVRLAFPAHLEGPAAELRALVVESTPCLPWPDAAPHTP